MAWGLNRGSRSSFARLKPYPSTLWIRTPIFFCWDKYTSKSRLRVATVPSLLLQGVPSAGARLVVRFQFGSWHDLDGCEGDGCAVAPLKRWLRRCSASSMRAPAFSAAMFTTRSLRCSRRMQFHSCSRPGSPYKSDSTVRMVLREIPAYLTIHRASKMPEPDTRSRAGISPVPAAAPTTLKTGSPSGCSAQPSPAPFAARLAPPAFSPG